MFLPPHFLTINSALDNPSVSLRDHYQGGWLGGGRTPGALSLQAWRRDGLGRNMVGYKNGLNG